MQISDLNHTTSAVGTALLSEPGNKQVGSCIPACDLRAPFEYQRT